MISEINEYIGDVRELDFIVASGALKSPYGSNLVSIKEQNRLPINRLGSYYETNLGILYIHNGEGKLSLELAKRPLLYLKQALMHKSFLNELDRALLGQTYNMQFKNAIDEYITLEDAGIQIHNSDFAYITDKIISKISL